MKHLLAILLFCLPGYAADVHLGRLQDLTWGGTGADRVAVFASEEWTPANLTGLVLWLDAADTSTLWADTNATVATTNGGAVVRWDDKSGNARHAVRTDGSLTLSPSRASGWVKFLITQEIQLPSVPQQNNQDVIAVTDTTLIGTGYRAFMRRRYGGAGDRGWAPYFGLNTADYRPGIYWGANEAVWGADVRGEAIINWRAYETNKTWIAVNGGTPAVDASSSETGQTEFTAVGVSSAQQPAFSAGEIVIVNSLSVADRQRVEGYYAHKWNLTNSLPVDHPYRNAAP